MRVKTIVLLILVGLTMVVAQAGADEMKESAEIIGGADKLFDAGQYEKLDQMAARYTGANARTSSGLWKRSIFFAAVTDKTRAAKFYEPSAVDLEKQFLEWMRRNPASTTAHIGYAEALIAHAWYFRGDGSASSVRQQDWAPFHEYLEKARQQLMDHADDAVTDPDWYITMLKVAQGQDWPHDRFLALLDEGLGRFPYYYPIYFSAINYLLPQWHGSVGEIEAFANAAAKYTEQDDGLGMYARIYWDVSQKLGGRNIFTYTQVDWSRMSTGIDDVLARYPDQWNINNFARLACLAQDPQKTRELIARIENPPISQVWKNSRPGFADCRALAGF